MTSSRNDERIDQSLFDYEELSDNSLQLAENENVDDEEPVVDYDKKRHDLRATKISRQTWSIIEIFNKLKSNNLILNPDYQRNIVWQKDKKTSFIESLYMGIMIPPIYVVEIPGKDILDEIRYEVVDGKQRLSSIKEFLADTLILKDKSLEYYADLFGGKKFSEIKDIANSETSEMLSSILDVYVITSSSPVEIKYDIFARLNKGAEKLKVNEIRRAIYHSDVTTYISSYVARFMDEKDIDKYSYYREIFTQNDIKRYEDFGRLYRSLAFYLNSDKEQLIVKDYNSRPREMINNILQSFQNQRPSIDNTELDIVLDSTLKMRKILVNGNKDYIIDACIPFCVECKDKLFDKLGAIENDSLILQTLEKSPSTTKNVNDRLARVKALLEIEDV